MKHILPSQNRMKPAMNCARVSQPVTMCNASAFAPSGIRRAAMP
jgi:hypothetical protein